MAVVELRNLSKVFKAGTPGAVNNVNLETKEGEFLVLLGPSGSGKTTLLRMIAGLEMPTSGEIRIGGGVVNNLTPRERGIAMVFQSYALYPHLSVRENIAFPLRAQKVPRQKHKHKVEWAAGLLSIEKLLDRKPRQLSGGERQRVALARAIVREPRVFLLDEPLSNLDAKLRASAREELERFHHQIKTTTIYVTHDQVEAMAMGERIVVLHQGEVRQIGSPKEVYEDPADTFVATFLGSPPMNLLEYPGVIVGFRPESLVPADIIPGSAQVNFRFRVKYVEYLGAERVLYGSLENVPFTEKEIVSRLSWTMPSGYEAGGVYDFAVAEMDLRFFDPQTLKRAKPRPYPWQ